MRIVCPECDGMITVRPEQVGAKIRCNQCGQALKIHRKPPREVQNHTHHPGQQNELPNSPASGHGGTFGDRSISAEDRANSMTNRPQTGVANPPELPAEAPSAPLLSADQAVASASVVRLRRRHRQRRLNAVAATVLLAIFCVIGVFASYYVISRQASNFPELPLNDQKVDDQLSNLVVDEGGTDSDSIGSLSEPVVIPAVRPPIERQVLAYFTPSEFDLAWQRIRPHVVQLSVETADGEKEIGGVIVSPLGWVVTSLGGLRGARRVVVKQAPVDRLIDAGSDQLEDEVRGVLGVFPEHDIVIVGINRKLVSALVAPPLNTRPLVSSLHLIQTAPPGPDRWPWATEARINVSPLDRGVPADLMNRTREKGFNIDVHSLGHTKISRSSPGGGLFDVEGRLVGINSSIQLEDDLLIIGAATIQTLMSSVAGQTTEIHELPGFDRQQLRAGSEVTTSHQLASASPEHPGVPLLAELNSLTSQLGQRGWRASTPDEYEQWRHLADLYRQLVPYQDDLDQPPEFRRQVIREMERLNAVWRSDLLNMSEEQVRALNDLGWAALKQASPERGKDLPFVFLVQVHLPVLNSPQIAGKPTVTMRFQGLDSYFIAPFDPSNTLLMRQAEWLVFVERTNQRPRSILDDEGKTLAAESLSILLLPAKIR